MAELTAIESNDSAPETEDNPLDAVRYECELLGAPMTILPKLRGYYAILEVDTKYSPKVRMQSLSNGNVGTMKILKKTFHKTELKPGMLIHLDNWTRKQAWNRPGVTELWIEKYSLA